MADSGSGAMAHTSAAESSSHCPAYSGSEYAAAVSSVDADPSNWIAQIVNAPPGAEVLLADGVYQLDRYAVVFEKPLTLRSASGNREAVVIEGQGYGENAEALMIMADDVHIADLTVKNIRNHGISIKEGFARSVIYNVDLIDVGTQHIKGSRMGPDGLIACSNIGYTTDVGPGDYNGAIDLHGAVNWTIRDNTIYNIWGDGSGCEVDINCGSYYPGGGPAILLWNDSRDNIVERNRIMGSFRGISLGLDTPYSGGVVRDNLVYLDVTGKEGVEGFIEHDTGISLIGASNVIVEGNTVLLAGGYPGPVELQNVDNVIVRNNLISAPVWNRGDAQYNGCENRSVNDCDSAEYGNMIFAAPLKVAVTDGSQTVATAEAEDNSVVASNASQGQAAGTIVESLPVHNATVDEETSIPPMQEQASSGESADSANSLQALMQQLAEVVELAREERIKGMEERLKMKEERLQFIEMMSGAGSASALTDLTLRKRLRNIEALLKQLEE